MHITYVCRFNFKELITDGLKGGITRRNQIREQQIKGKHRDFTEKNQNKTTNNNKNQRWQSVETGNQTDTIQKKNPASSLTCTLQVLEQKIKKDLGTRQKDGDGMKSQLELRDLTELPT